MQAGSWIRGGGWRGGRSRNLSEAKRLQHTSLEAKKNCSLSWDCMKSIILYIVFHRPGFLQLVLDTSPVQNFFSGCVRELLCDWSESYNGWADLKQKFLHFHFVASAEGCTINSWEHQLGEAVKMHKNLYNTIIKVYKWLICGKKNPQMLCTEESLWRIKGLL